MSDSLTSRGEGRRERGGTGEGGEVVGMGGTAGAKAARYGGGRGVVSGDTRKLYVFVALQKHYLGVYRAT